MNRELPICVEVCEPLVFFFRLDQRPNEGICSPVYTSVHLLEMNKKRGGGGKGDSMDVPIQNPNIAKTIAAVASPIDDNVSDEVSGMIPVFPRAS
jgi:hypothetical protein